MSETVALMRPQTLDLSSLYEAHARVVWRTLLRLGVSTAGIEDAVQEVFLTAHQRSEDFEGRSSASTWLLGISVRVAANARRAQQRRGFVVPLSAELPADAKGLDEALDRRRRLFDLEQVLRQLPDEQREVVVLMELEQLTAPEVAEVLSVKLNTVYSRLRLARAALSTALNDRREEAP
ncbi:MAG: RNA polymerase sigma factor [Myxococcaceae bacterium]|nr:RNA polymerase sigma factor [Myxococcaceae bacterium]